VRVEAVRDEYLSQVYPYNIFHCPFEALIAITVKIDVDLDLSGLDSSWNIFWEPLASLKGASCAR